MRLANVKEGDIVQVDKRGRRFYAMVEGKGEAMGRSVVLINPRQGFGVGMVPTERSATAREVIGHWSKRT